MSRAGALEVGREAWQRFRRNQATDLAAALTYYAVLAIFPGLLALLSLVGLFGQKQQTATALLNLVARLGQAEVVDTLRGPVEALVNRSGAGYSLAIGIAGALWSASGYVAAFTRAMNRVYDVEETRAAVPLRARQLVITVCLVALAALVLVGLVVSGPVAQAVGDAFGVGSQVVAAWDLVKIPVILVVVTAMVALLYYATADVRRQVRLLSVGAAVAIGIWVVASVGFGFYVANFGRYDTTYGSLGGVVIALLWLWITNAAVLFGAEIDAARFRRRGDAVAHRDGRQDSAEQGRSGRSAPTVATLEPLPSERARALAAEQRGARRS